VETKGSFWKILRKMTEGFLKKNTTVRAERVLGAPTFAEASNWSLKDSHRFVRVPLHESKTKFSRLRKTPERRGTVWA
jgi:hypothetical protein